MPRDAGDGRCGRLVDADDAADDARSEVGERNRTVAQVLDKVACCGRSS